jgi:hypothetical protein
MVRILSPSKVHRPRPGMSPGPVASKLTTIPPRPTCSVRTTHVRSAVVRIKRDLLQGPFEEYKTTLYALPN